MGYAPEPARSTGKITIAFGLVSVPVDVFNGVDDNANAIHRQQRSVATAAPVKYSKVDSETGAVLTMDEIKTVVVEPDGTEIDLSDEEIDKAMGLVNGSCNLVGFFDLAYLHAYETRQIMQVRPQSVKSGKRVTQPFAKPYALLMKSMQSTGTFALLTYVMRGKLHLAGLTADGVMRDYYWTNEIRMERPQPEVEVGDKESALALLLVEKMRLDDLPALDNTAIAAVHEYVEAKANGQVPEAAEAAAPEPAMDLEALLAAALKS